MTRLRNTNLSVFIQCQYTRTILRNKNMGQSLFKKHSKFQKFDEIFYCGMTRLRNTNLDVFIQCQYTRTISRNKNMGQTLFKKHSKFLILNKVFYGDMAKRGTNNKKFLGNIFTQKHNFKKHFILHKFSELFYCGMTRLRNTNLSVFIQCQYTRTILRNKNMGQSLFKTNLKFQKFDEILYCGMNRFRKG